MTTAREALQALFSQGREVHKKEQEAKRLEKEAEAKRRLARSTGNHSVRGSEAEALALLARQIEAELQWTSRTLVTVFNEQHCLKCDSRVEHLLSVMVEQEHKHDRTARRLLRSVENHPLLPKRRETWTEHVEVCASCYTNVQEGLPAIVPLPLIARKDEETDDATNTEPQQ